MASKMHPNRVDPILESSTAPTRDGTMIQEPTLCTGISRPGPDVRGNALPWCYVAYQVR